MNTFINQLTEEVLNEAFDIKSIANAFFAKHPGLLKQVKNMCGSFKPDIKLNKADYNVIKEIYINNNMEKAKQLIKGLYKPQDKKYSYLMSMMNVNEAVSKKLLGLAFMLALSSGLLVSCDMMMMDTMESHIETVIDQELYGDFVHTYNYDRYDEDVNVHWIFDGTNKTLYKTDRRDARYSHEWREIEIENGGKIRFRKWSDDPLSSHGWSDWGTYSFYEKDGVTNIYINIWHNSFRGQRSN